MSRVIDADTLGLLVVVVSIGIFSGPSSVVEREREKERERKRGQADETGGRAVAQLGQYVSAHLKHTCTRQAKQTILVLTSLLLGQTRHLCLLTGVSCSLLRRESRAERASPSRLPPRVPPRQETERFAQMLEKQPSFVEFA